MKSNWLHEQGVKSIVTIREEPLNDDWIDDMNYLHVLSDDMGVPSFDDLKNSVDCHPQEFKIMSQ